MSFNKHKEFKEALWLCDKESINAFAASLVKPDGEIGVTHTAVIRVSVGKDNTPWIQEAIEAKIQEAKNRFPEFYKDKSSKEVA